MSKEDIKNWAIGNWLFIMLFGLMVFFGLIDYIQLETFHELNTPEAWQLYSQYTSPALLALWVALIIIPIFVYWLFSKDLSESLGLMFAGLILLFTGWEDIFFFLFSPSKMVGRMCWFNEVRAPVAKFSELLGAECVLPLHLWIFALIGLVLAFSIYQLTRHIEFGKHI